MQKKVDENTVGTYGDLERYLHVSVYPRVKWEGILDAVNRLPLDVAER